MYSSILKSLLLLGNSPGVLRRALVYALYATDVYLCYYFLWELCGYLLHTDEKDIDGPCRQTYTYSLAEEDGERSYAIACRVDSWLEKVISTWISGFLYAPLGVLLEGIRLYPKSLKCKSNVEIVLMYTFDNINFELVTFFLFATFGLPNLLTLTFGEDHETEWNIIVFETVAFLNMAFAIFDMAAVTFVFFFSWVAFSFFSYGNGSCMEGICQNPSTCQYIEAILSASPQALFETIAPNATSIYGINDDLQNGCGVAYIEINGVNVETINSHDSYFGEPSNWTTIFYNITSAGCEGYCTSASTFFRQYCIYMSQALFFLLIWYSVEIMILGPDPRLKNLPARKEYVLGLRGLGGILLFHFIYLQALLFGEFTVGLAMHAFAWLRNNDEGYTFLDYTVSVFREYTEGENLDCSDRLIQTFLSRADFISQGGPRNIIKESSKFKRLRRSEGIAAAIRQSWRRAEIEGEGLQKETEFVQNPVGEGI
ncbi:hypothetical protein TrVE_jg13807 [Triparma verrucosa]|uniref:Uncharacterized protein n=1 Tax=Triparma verrucosa TaxID=1606542 RepID=A0A9W7C5K1_9STRA|nr:hypothetical protein TrVE_jg13807 [Triparma verrucosa]